MHTFEDRYVVSDVTHDHN